MSSFNSFGLFMVVGILYIYVRFFLDRLVRDRADAVVTGVIRGVSVPTKHRWLVLQNSWLSSVQTCQLSGVSVRAKLAARRVELELVENERHSVGALASNRATSVLSAKSMSLEPWISYRVTVPSKVKSSCSSSIPSGHAMRVAPSAPNVSECPEVSYEPKKRLQPPKP